MGLASEENTTGENIQRSDYGYFQYVFGTAAVCYTNVVIVQGTSNERYEMMKRGWVY